MSMDSLAKFQELIKSNRELHKELGKIHPALRQGLVRCDKCERELKVDSAKCLATGWPECHGQTMRLMR